MKEACHLFQKWVKEARPHLEVSQFGECVNDDAKDDVETDGRDEDEERQMIDAEEAEPVECVLCGMVVQVLSVVMRTHVLVQ